MTDFAPQKQRVLELIGKAVALAEHLNNPDVAERLHDFADRLRSGRLVVVVAGEFKRGKSSLINAYLEDPGLLPTDVDIATRLVTTVSWGEHEEVTVYLGDSQEPKRRRIDRSEIPDYVTEQGNPRNTKHAQLVTVSCPNERLRSGLVLVDTPGIGGQNTEHTAATLTYLPNADAVVFVADCIDPLASKELEFIERVLPKAAQVLFVLTRTDLVLRPEPVIDATRQAIARRLQRPPEQVHLVPVSNKLKLDYLENRDPEDLAESNFEALERELWRLLEQESTRTLLLRPLGEIESVTGVLKLPLESARAAYSRRSEEDLNELGRNLEEADERLAALSTGTAEWRTLLHRQLRNMRQDTQSRFAAELCDIETRVHRVYLEDEAMLADPAQIGDRIYEDLALLLGETGKALAAQVGRVQTTVEDAAQLSLARPDIGELTLVRPKLPPAPDPARPSSADAAPRQRLRRMLQVARGYSDSGSPGELLGGLIGGILAGVFSGGLGAPAGFVIGSAIGSVIGGASGIRSELDKLRAGDRAELKRGVATIVEPFLQSCKHAANHKLTQVINRLEDASRDALEKQIVLERKTVEKARGDLAAARLAGTEEAMRRSTEIDAALASIECLENEVSAVVDSLETRDPVGTAGDIPGQPPEGPSAAEVPPTAAHRGGFADV